MKRIKLIAKGKGIINTTLKEKKINRAVEAAIDKTEENEEICNEKTELILNDLAVAETTEEINAIINNYIDNYKDKEGWKESRKAIEELKSALNAEVKKEEVEEN